MKSSLFPVQELKRRTFGWAKRLRVNPKVVRVQEMRNKWGSCSSAGTVTLASDLAEQDQRFQDYVIVHELLHLRLSTHGRVFKALMSAHVPGYVSRFIAVSYSDRSQSIPTPSRRAA